MRKWHYFLQSRSGGSIVIRMFLILLLIICRILIRKRGAWSKPRPISHGENANLIGVSEISPKNCSIALDVKANAFCKPIYLGLTYIYIVFHSHSKSAIKALEVAREQVRRTQTKRRAARQTDQRDARWRIDFPGLLFTDSKLKHKFTWLLLLQFTLMDCSASSSHSSCKQ